MVKMTVALNCQNRRIGQGHPNAKLTDADVDLAFELRETGISLSKIAEKLGVGKACIHKIVSGRSRCQLPTRWVVVRVGEDGRKTRTVSNDGSQRRLCK